MDYFGCGGSCQVVSACMLSTLTIKVHNSQKSTVFIQQIKLFEKNENKQKEVEIGIYLKMKSNWMYQNLFKTPHCTDTRKGDNLG